MQMTLRFIVLLFGFLVSGLHAEGTPVGTAIANQAEIAYAVNGIPNTLSSNEDLFVVDRIVDVRTSWQDTESVKVAAGDLKRVLTFVVTNEGNGDDNFTLGYDHNTSSDFLPTDRELYLDDGDGIFDPAHDTLVTHISLGHDHNATLFIVANIPDDNSTAPNKRSWEILRATTESNATAGADQSDVVDVVIRTGTDADTGIYEIRDFWLESHKSVTVHSDDNATHTGTRVTYTIEYLIGGHAAGHTITQVLVQDNIPANTVYVPGSLTHDGIGQTDAADGDRGQCDGTTVRVDAGDISGATHHNITFDIRIK